MEPTIKEGSEVLASSFPYIFFNPKKGDIVVFKKNNLVFIKRIEKVLKGKYFVKGDNEKDSIDSRSFGFLNKNNILGKIIFNLV